MILITIIISNLIWIVYSLSEGVRDGFYTHYKNTSRRVCNFDISSITTIQRLMVLIGIGGVFFYTSGAISLIFSLCMWLMFKFCRDGAYNYVLCRLEEKEIILTPIKSNGFLNKNMTMLTGIMSQIFVYMFVLN